MIFIKLYIINLKWYDKVDKVPKKYQILYMYLSVRLYTGETESIIGHGDENS